MGIMKVSKEFEDAINRYIKQVEDKYPELPMKITKVEVTKKIAPWINFDNLTEKKVKQPRKRKDKLEIIPNLLGKKGDANIIYILIFLFVIAIITIFMYRAWIIIQPMMETATGLDNPEKIRKVSGETARGIAMMDYLYVILLGGIFMALIISSFYLDTQPLYFWVFLLGIIIVLIVAPIFSNTYNAISKSSAFNTNATDTFPIIDNVSNNLGKWMLVFSIVLGIALYAKFKLFKGGE